MARATSSKAHSSKANAQRARTRAHRSTIAQRNRTSLSLFRQLTHPRSLRDFHQSRILTKREATKGALSPFSGFNRAIQSVLDYPQKVCRARKERRQVLFALNKTGAGSRARTHRMTTDSKVRC